MTACRLARREQPRDRGAAELFGSLARSRVRAGADDQHDARTVPSVIDELLGNRRRVAFKTLAVERAQRPPAARAPSDAEARAVLARDRQHQRISPSGRRSAKLIFM